MGTAFDRYIGIDDSGAETCDSISRTCASTWRIMQANRAKLRRLPASENIGHARQLLSGWLRGSQRHHSHWRALSTGFPSRSNSSRNTGAEATWLGIANGNVAQDQDVELRCNCSNFKRVYVPYDAGNNFKDLCGYVKKTCEKVCDWEERALSCGAVSLGGNRDGNRYNIIYIGRSGRGHVEPRRRRVGRPLRRGVSETARQSNAVNFEWDPRKATQNRRKHGVSFHEAATPLYGIRAYSGRRTKQATHHLTLYHICDAEGRSFESLRARRFYLNAFRHWQ